MNITFTHDDAWRLVHDRHSPQRVDLSDGRGLPGRRGGERRTPNPDLMSTIHHSSVRRPLFGVTGQAPHDDLSQAASFVSRIPGEPTTLLVLLFDVSGPARLGAHLAHADSIVSTLRWTEPA